MSDFSLIIVCRNEFDEPDFREIAQKVIEQAPDITPVVVRSGSRQPVPEALWLRPTLVVAFSATFALQPRRGMVLRSLPILKTDQYKLFHKAGVATPRTDVFKFGMTLDPNEWSDYVILKPLRINSKGLGIHLVRTRRIGALKPDTFKANHPIHKDIYVVQQFIDTGDYPTHFRVETLLGEALCCRTIFSSVKRPPLAASDGTLLDGKVASNAVTKGSNFTKPARDDDVIAFARQMDLALPRIPLKGCDVLKEVGTGKLYALECNPGGNSWAFNSPDGDNARDAFGGKQGMIDHLGAWDAAARAFINRTRAEAS
jgi:hypothetical protein